MKAYHNTMQRSVMYIFDPYSFVDPTTSAIDFQALMLWGDVVE